MQAGRHSADALDEVNLDGMATVILAILKSDS
ncbi:hypothetical protein SAMN05878276_0716 [Aquipseudomonas alcaligenes]|nr:hypothetical protein SAMN05878276_0716 [Pseudomonas alcaligenes]